jgi:hypothetical protein
MLKSLTLSLSLAVALGMCSVSMAGGLDQNCTTCGLASPQGGPYASAQNCDTGCAPKKCHFNFHMPKIHCNLPKLCHTTSYEWVLKKKHCFSLQHNKGGNACAAGAPVYATGQGGAAPSGQGASGQAYGAGQHAYLPAKPATSLAAVPAEMTPAIAGGEEAPPAPEVRETSAIGSPNGGLLLPTPSGN